MISGFIILLCICLFVLGVIAGFVGGVFYYAKQVYPKTTTEEVTRDTVNSLIYQQETGDFITVNPVEEYLKNNAGNEVKLGDVLEDDER